jgi:hypothetical protein
MASLPVAISSWHISGAVLYAALPSPPAGRPRCQLPYLPSPSLVSLPPPIPITTTPATIGPAASSTPRSASAGIVPGAPHGTHIPRPPALTPTPQHAVHRRAQLHALSCERLPLERHVHNLGSGGDVPRIFGVLRVGCRLVGRVRERCDCAEDLAPPDQPDVSGVREQLLECALGSGDGSVSTVIA